MNIQTLGERYWNGLLESNPLLATQVGDERFDDKLPDLGPFGIGRRRGLHAAAVAQARELRPTAVSLWDRLVCDAIEAMAWPEVRAIDLGLYRLAPIDQLWGPGTLLDQLASLQRVDTPVRLARYLGRLAAASKYLRDAGGLLEDLDDGVVAPRVLVDRCIRQVEEILATPIDTSVAVRPISAEMSAARQRVADVLGQTVYPAYARYVEVLRDYRMRSRDSIGLWDMPKGDEMYGVCIERATSLPLAANEIHETGSAELLAIQTERNEIAQSVGARDPAEAIANHVASGHDSFSSREEIVELARQRVDRGWQSSKGFFQHMPATNCEVRAVDPSRENDILEFYQAGTPDGQRPPIFFVNTARPTERQRHSLAATIYHESNPGHHLQTALQLEQSDRPPLLALAGDLTGPAIAEGWGLYSERLADEMGLYADPYECLGMLELQALRAARLMVDTGIHALHWSREQVIETLDSTGLSHDRSVLETDRYIALPGQALSYKIGQLEIEQQRRREAESAPDFSLADFHDRVLQLGSVPLTAFRREIATTSP